MGFLLSYRNAYGIGVGIPAGVLACLLAFGSMSAEYSFIIDVIVYIAYDGGLGFADNSSDSCDVQLFSILLPCVSLLQNLYLPDLPLGVGFRSATIDSNGHSCGKHRDTLCYGRVIAATEVAFHWFRFFATGDQIGK